MVTVIVTKEHIWIYSFNTIVWEHGATYRIGGGGRGGWFNKTLNLMKILEDKDLKRDVMKSKEKDPERIYISYKFQSKFKH